VALSSVQFPQNRFGEGMKSFKLSRNHLSKD